MPRIALLALLAIGCAHGAQAQTDDQRGVLAMAATIYTAHLTCPGGLDPDPTETVAMLVAASGVAPADVAAGGRYHALFESLVVDLAGEMKGKAPGEACALLTAKYPKWIRPRAP